MEAGQSPSGGLGSELDRIESSVDTGDTDLRGLGFWRVVALIKRDVELIERYADQVGRIDAKAFQARVRLRVPVWVGNVALVAVAAIGVGGLMVAGARGTHNFSFTYDPFLTGVGLLVAAGAWAVGLHSPTHWLVGRLAGIRFTDYFLGGPPPPRPGLKTDYASYLRADPVSRAWMHASGAIATKLAPFLVLALASRVDAPGWSIALLWVIGVGQIVTDVLFSTKTSDWKKVRRELAVARARERAASAGA